MTSKEVEFPAEFHQIPPYGEGFDAYRLRTEACDVLLAVYPAGTVIEPHRHDDKDIHGVVTKGRVHLVIDGDERTYAPGDWFHVPTSAEHAARFDVDTVEIEFWFPPAT